MKRPSLGLLKFFKIVLEIRGVLLFHPIHLVASKVKPLMLMSQNVLLVSWVNFQGICQVLLEQIIRFTLTIAGVGIMLF